MFYQTSCEAMSVQLQKNELIGGEDHDVSLNAPRADDDSIDWDESLLTNAFDNSLKLVERSLHGPTTSDSITQGRSPIVKEQKDQTIPKSKVSSKKKQQTTQQQQKEVVLTHQSRRVKYIDPCKDQLEGKSCSFENNYDSGSKNLPNIMAHMRDFPSKSVVPPVFDTSNFPSIDNEDEARASMLMSWYMAGYHTGYFEAMKKFKK